MKQDTYTNPEGLKFIFRQDEQGQITVTIQDGNHFVPTTTPHEVAEEFRRLACPHLTP